MKTFPRCWRLHTKTVKFIKSLENKSKREAMNDLSSSGKKTKNSDSSVYRYKTRLSILTSNLLLSVARQHKSRLFVSGC